MFGISLPLILVPDVWHSITGFNLREEDYIYEYILFGFPRKSDNTIVANCCILHAKQYIYLEKLKNKNTNFNVDFLGICHT